MLVSILGDSISTYEGYNPPGYAVFYDGYIREKNSLLSVNDTWWAQVISAIDGQLCVNNSYSGSKVSGTGFPAASSFERLKSLSVGDKEPDLILVYLGFNDFGNGVEIGRHFLRKGDTLTFEDAYSTMLARIRNLYPKAEIACGTLMRSHLAGNPNWQFPEMFCGVPFEAYNDAIRKISKRKYRLVDLSALNLRYETLDGTHPTASGHKTIAEAWLQSLTR